MQMRNLASGMFYDLPGLTRSSGQSILLEPGKWFAFLKKIPQRGGEMATVETRSEPHCGNEVGTPRRDVGK